MTAVEDRQIPALHEMTPWGREVAEAYYLSGYVAGVAEGRRREDAELGALQRAAVATARAAADRGPYADLAEKRGEPDRAARQRALLAERGVTR